MESFNHWFWGAYANCFICDNESKWEGKWVEVVSSCGIFIYRCSRCKLKAIQIMDSRKRWAMCWVWVGDNFEMEVDVHWGQYKFEKKPTYKIEDLLNTVRERSFKKLEIEIDKLIKEHNERWDYGKGKVTVY